MPAALEKALFCMVGGQVGGQAELLKIKNARKPGVWRREEDLNLRYVSGVHTISKTEKSKKQGKAS